jgi:hypothetical protein
MKTYKGTVHLIGAGKWANGITTLSVLEIGDHSIKNVTIIDYLTNYLTVNTDARIFVSRGILGGLKSSIDAIEVNGRKHKADTGKIGFLHFLRAFFYTAIIAITTVLIFAAFDATFVGLFLGLLLSVPVVRHYYSGWSQLKSF